MVANRLLKARPKATPVRINETIRNAKVIKAGAILDNTFIHLADAEQLSIDNLPEGALSVPLEFWLANKDGIKQRGDSIAVQIAGDEAPEDLVKDLDDIDVVVLPIVNFVDGQSYSHAHKLRQRFAFQGEVRAIGDVHFDQLGFLARCGCDAFELPDGDNHEDALRAFTELSEVYQPAADGAPLIFSRRRQTH